MARLANVALATGGYKMAQDGKLKLELVDVYGKRLQENDLDAAYRFNLAQAW